MFEIKDLDLSHVTTLHLTMVESGAFYVDKLYGDEKTLSKVMELVKGAAAKDPAKEENAEGEPRQKSSHSHDYSNSPLKNYLAHPEDVNRTLAWLHLHSDFQTDLSMRLQPLRALIVHKVFSSPIPQSVYEAEFGKINQSVYSRCVSSGDRYSKEGLEILAESLKTFDYDEFVKRI